MRRALIPWLILSALSGTPFVTAEQGPPPPPSPQTPPQVPVRGGRAGGPPPARTGTGLVIGRVVEAGSATGVAGAVVTIAGANAASQRVQVDASGRFMFRNLPSGDFSITAAKPGYVGGLVGQRLPGGPSRPLTLAEGERIEDLALRLWRAGAIAGTVIDDFGEPVVGLKVTLAERRLINGKYRIDPSQQSTTTTDDRGAYRFGTVAPGEYFVMARTSEEEIARGLMSLVVGDPSVIMPFAAKAMGGRPEDLIAFDSALRVYPPVFYPSAFGPSQASAVTVRSGEARSGIDIRVKLAPIARLAGTFAGLPSPMQGNPRVSLILDDPDMGDYEVAQAIDTSNSKFTFLAVPAGRYLLRATYEPRTPPMPQMMPGGGPAGRGRGGPPPFPTESSYWALVPINAGTDDTSNVELTMRPGVTMSGRIAFDGAAALPERERLEQLQIFPVSEANTPGQFRGKVDGEGAFVTTSLPPGRFRFRAMPIGSWLPLSAILDGKDLFDEAVDVASTNLADIVVTFTDRQPGSIGGTIRDAMGAPDPYALVVIFPADPRLRTDFSGNSRRMKLARTTKTGQYAIPGLPAGEYLLVAGGDELFETWLSPAGLETLAGRATPVDISEGASRSLDLRSGGTR